MAPSSRAMKPSRLIPMKTLAFTELVGSRPGWFNLTSGLGRRPPRVSIADVDRHLPRRPAAAARARRNGRLPRPYSEVVLVVSAWRARPRGSGGLGVRGTGTALGDSLPGRRRGRSWRDPRRAGARASRKVDGLPSALLGYGHDLPFGAPTRECVLRPGRESRRGRSIGRW